MNWGKKAYQNKFCLSLYDLFTMDPEIADDFGG
jgi:hypothetical protein